MDKVTIIVSFFIITPLTLLLSSIMLLYTSHERTQGNFPFSFFTPPQTVAYAALPTAHMLFRSRVEQKDARVEIVRQFFKQYGSPLEPYAKDVVAAADLYGLDFKLLPAIAMQESNLCKKIPKGSYNCWGFGIYGSNVKRFKNYPHAIKTVTKTLAKEYKGDGLHSPSEIMTRYTPSSNGSWANGVNYFMSQLQ